MNFTKNNTVQIISKVFFNDVDNHGPREVRGITYTPSSLRYAAEAIPQITAKNSGGLPLGSSRIRDSIVFSDSALSSISPAPMLKHDGSFSYTPHAGYYLDKIGFP